MTSPASKALGSSVRGSEVERRTASGSQGIVRQRRGPRPEEVELMRGLLRGPAAVMDGPIGRCCKRGWCRAIVVSIEGGNRLAGPATFELTEAGRAIALGSGS